MKDEKPDWTYVSIGWCAGLVVARLASGLPNDQAFLAIAVLFALPFAVWWLNGMISVFKTRPTPPSAEQAAASAADIALHGEAYSAGREYARESSFTYEDAMRMSANYEKSSSFMIGWNNQRKHPPSPVAP